MKGQYVSHDHAQEQLSICRMSERHDQLLDSFARSLLKYPRHRELLPSLRSAISSRRFTLHIFSTSPPLYRFKGLPGITPQRYPLVLHCLTHYDIVVLFSSKNQVNK